jgi:hypothetical protein
MATYSFTEKQMTEFFNKVEEKFSGSTFTHVELMNMEGMPKLTKKAKKSKDPNAPKKARSAWIYYMDDNRPKLKKEEEHSDKSMTELTTVMSHMWKECSDKDKAPFKKMADEDKLRFKKDMVGYTSNSDTESDSDKEVSDKVGKKEKVKKVKDPNAPKRNSNIYMHFTKDIRSKNPDVKYTASVLKPMWADIEDKAPYQKMADDDKARYLKEKKEYEESQ